MILWYTTAPSTVDTPMINNTTKMIKIINLVLRKAFNTKFTLVQIENMYKNLHV